MTSKNLMLTATLFVLAASAPLLSACHTTAGAGTDISKAGHAITNDANRNTP